MHPIRRTLEFLRPYRWRVALAVVLTLLVTVLNVLPPRLFELAIDEGVGGTGHRAGAERRLLIIGAVLIGVVVGRSALNYGLNVLTAWIGHRFCFDLRFATWRHLHKLSLAFHNQTQTGKIMARCTGDIELIQGLIQGQLVMFISDVVTLFAVLCMLFWIEWRIAAIIVGLIPFYVISYLMMLRRIREISLEQRRLWDEMLGKLAEKIAGIHVVKAFVRERYETQNFMSSVRAKFAVDMQQVKLNRFLGLLSGVISAVGTAVVYAYGGQLVQAGDLTVGSLVAITFYIGYVFNPAVRVVDFNNAVQWAVAAMNRVFQTLDTRPDVADNPGAAPAEPLQRSIVFDDVSFGYHEGKPAISEVNLSVTAGETIALVGHSGSGKTTLMNLLMRFYDPTVGAILFDGKDLRELRLASLRDTVSMVAQENVLFSVSILENIKYGAKNASDEQALAASQAADLHSFVMELEDGYDTLIGEKGMKLSGGQKQRLALARALVTNPSVLILDDVTSALDGETEVRVQESLRQVMRGRTTFIIAHRLSSVVEADRIVVLDSGRIANIGTHAELIEIPGVYRDMYREQFKSVLEQTQ